MYIAKLVPLLAGGGLVRPFGREFGGAGKKRLLEARRLIRTLLATLLRFGILAGGGYKLQVWEGASGKVQAEVAGVDNKS